MKEEGAYYRHKACGGLAWQYFHFGFFAHPPKCQLNRVEKR